MQSGIIASLVCMAWLPNLEEHDISTLIEHSRALLIVWEIAKDHQKQFYKSPVKFRLSIVSYTASYGCLQYLSPNDIILYRIG